MPVEVYSSSRETWETERFEELVAKRKLLPHVRERSRGRSDRKLESELDGQLYAARTAASANGLLVPEGPVAERLKTTRS